MKREEESALSVGEVRKETTITARRRGENASTASAHKEEPIVFVGSLKTG